MESRKFTCTVCPMGCQLEVELNGGEIVSVSGNTCRRGDKYARSEITNPVRTLTSTVVITGSTLKLMPVRTDKPVPKGELLPLMEKIHAARIAAPIHIGDVVIADILPGINLIACSEG